jgi:hypothetical protein
MNKKSSAARPFADANARAHHLGDYPYSYIGGHLLLWVFLCVDVATMHILIAGASNSSDFVAWVLAIGIPAGLAAIALWAAEVTMRYVSERRPGQLWGALGLGLIWAGTLATILLFRKSTSQVLLATTDSSAGVHMAGQPTTTATTSSGGSDLALALMLTAFLVLTSVTAFATGAVGHDPLQKRRRQAGRRVLQLRARRRLQERRRSRAERAAKLQHDYIADLEKQRDHSVEQLPHRAKQLKNEVRTRIAKALGDPASTSDLHNATPV